MSERLLDKRWPWLAAATALIAFGIGSFALQSRTPRDPRPVGSADDIAALPARSDTNLLFVLIDTLRADRLGAYGYERDTSPAIDRIAASGVRFARHLSQSSWTKASMASLWTSLNPVRAGITRFDQVLPADAELPAEVLREAGFRTAGIYRNGWVAPTFGFDQGFEVYMRPSPQSARARVEVRNPTLYQGGTDEDIVAAALEFLRIHGEQRWFLYLHLMDLHEYLYDEESALFGGSYSDIYDNSIRWTDRTLGILLEYLDAWGHRDDTIIAIASDHGEAFQERGFEGHAREVYRETTEVPFILSLPFRLEPGLVIETRTRNVDVWPTLLELVGVDAPSQSDGQSLLGDLVARARGEGGRADDRTAVAHLDQTWGQQGDASRHAVAVAEAHFRYVKTPATQGEIEELFDSRSDPAERIDRSAAEPEVLERLRDVANDALGEAPPWGTSPRREVGELELNQLRALGYAIP